MSAKQGKAAGKRTGRPTKLEDSVKETAYKLCLLGATDAEMAKQTKPATLNAQFAPDRCGRSWLFLLRLSSSSSRHPHHRRLRFHLGDPVADSHDGFRRFNIFPLQPSLLVLWFNRTWLRIATFATHVDHDGVASSLSSYACQQKHLFRIESLPAIRVKAIPDLSRRLIYREFRPQQ